ncbi:unnamed protein product [Urochloa decumbens]|uniref:Uncharacterized protein n=1 Tax=Urochloa decumbens TaxID=240449 RepID=A0ABC8VCZ9_9POAL
MATKSLLLVPVTLCFLVLLAAQGTEAAADRLLVAVFQGQARCGNNPAGTVISNATVQVVINSTTVMAAGQTTTDGHFLVTANLTMTMERMNLLLSNATIEAVFNTRPQACGGATRLSAPMSINGFGVFGARSKVIAGLRDILGSKAGDAAGGVRPNIAASNGLLSGGILDAIGVTNDANLDKCVLVTAFRLVRGLP